MTKQAVQWRLIDFESYPGDIWHDWQALCRSHHASNPMLDAVFVRLLVEYFGSDIYVLQGEQDGTTRTLALLENSAKGVWRGFRPSQAQAALVVGKPASTIDTRAIVKALPGISLRLDLQGLDPREHEPFLQPSPSVQLDNSLHDMCVDISGSFEDYWNARPRNLRKNMRRYRKRLDDEVGKAHLLVLSRPDDIAMATDRYGIIETRGWKGRNGTALHPDNRQGGFYRELMTEMADQSRALVYELYAGDHLLASRLCVTGDVVMVILKTTFDEEFRRYGVGRQLLYETLKHVFEQRGASAVDFYTDASRDQLEWSTSDRWMSNGSYYRSSISRQAAVAARRLLSAHQPSVGTEN